MKKIILVLCAIPSAIFAIETGGGLMAPKAVARGISKLDQTFTQKLADEYAAVIKNAEDKFKAMSKTELIQFASDMVPKMYSEFSGIVLNRGYPIQVDQESIKQIYQDFTQAQQDLYIRLSIQALLLKYALTK